MAAALAVPTATEPRIAPSQSSESSVGQEVALSSQALLGGPLIPEPPQWSQQDGYLYGWDYRDTPQYELFSPWFPESESTSIKSSSWIDDRVSVANSYKSWSPAPLMSTIVHSRRFSERRNRSISTPFPARSPTISESSSKSIAKPPASQPCPQCPATFKRDGDYQRHLQKHTKPYPCDNCHRHFGSKADLHRHTREVHAERGHLEDSNRCPEKSCERHWKGFARKWNLNDHIKRRHRTGTDPPSNSQGEAETPSADAAGDSDENSSPGTSPSALTDVSTDSTSGPMKRNKSSDRVRHKIQSELVALRAQRGNIDVQISKLEGALQALDRLQHVSP